ncbi:extracellular solute-binding protein [Xylanibacillus composti]|uniref:Putative ABC transporter peptide-binding protein YtcQ n=1 Tax=Xylanibacillus composti TaxID=1572762 RepID=A0A8J4H7S2_9BACL|nr:extracellular solute-binding protein [Xylanibacillus composti]MDT9726353.1 extracellular solute-binding protein [Xylanibacillus composti]GIQ70539.1 putative ABC transporter peptide-binding protein YtcQ [Xylanibacillus composti]
MGNKKKWFILLCVMALTLSVFAGCASNGNNSASNDGNTGNTGSDANAGGNEASNDPVQIEIMLPMKEKEVPSDRLELLIEEMTNTELTFQWVPDGNYEEKLNAAFATNSLPQVVYMKNQNTFTQYKEAMRDGQFWEIGPYLQEFEGLSKLKDSILENTKVDGKIYTLYLGRPLARQGIIYRKDWADNLGLKEPKNVDDVYEMLRAFTEDDPDGNNQNDTIGLADREDLVYGAFKTVTSWFNAPNNWGEKDGQLLPEFMFDEYFEAMDWMKQVHSNGYMNKEFPVTSKEDQRNLFYNGTAGMYVGSLQDVNVLYSETKKNFPDMELDVAAIIEGPNGDFGMWTIPGYGNLIMFPKSAIETEEELRDILGFFDKQMTAELANLMYWGIEGEHYEVVDGGAKEYLDKADLIAREVKGYKDSLIGEPETNGRYDGYHELEPRVKVEQLILEMDQHLILDPTASLDSATYAESGIRLQELINDATFRYILGDIDRDGFQQAVDNWRSQGGDKMIEEFNAAWQASK